jgi:hypothetical protein
MKKNKRKRDENENEINKRQRVENNKINNILNIPNLIRVLNKEDKVSSEYMKIMNKLLGNIPLEGNNSIMNLFNECKKKFFKDNKKKRCGELFFPIELRDILDEDISQFVFEKKLRFRVCMSAWFGDKAGICLTCIMFRRFSITCCQIEKLWNDLRDKLTSEVLKVLKTDEEAYEILCLRLKCSVKLQINSFICPPNWQKCKCLEIMFSDEKNVEKVNKLNGLIINEAKINVFFS